MVKLKCECPVARKSLWTIRWCFYYITNVVFLHSLQTSLNMYTRLVESSNRLYVSRRYFLMSFSVLSIILPIPLWFTPFLLGHFIDVKYGPYRLQLIEANECFDIFHFIVKQFTFVHFFFFFAFGKPFLLLLILYCTFM